MGRSGTGLGMTVVWGTVKDYHGYIDIKSEEAKGTTFTIYFPATRKEIAEKKSSIPIDLYRAKGESILVVDDVEEQKIVEKFDEVIHSTYDFLYDDEMGILAAYSLLRQFVSNVK